MDLEQRVATLEMDLRRTQGKTGIAIGIALAALVLAFIQLLSKGL